MCKIIFRIKCNFGYILLLGHLRQTAGVCHICHIPQNTFIKPSYQPHAMWATHEDKTCDLKTTPVLFPDSINQNHNMVCLRWKLDSSYQLELLQNIHSGVLHWRNLQYINPQNLNIHMMLREAILYQYGCFFV